MLQQNVQNNTIDILTLGCSKNLVDTERLMGMLEKAGYVCKHDPKRPTAPIAIINTCGFIGDAKEESIRTILQFSKRKIDHRHHLQKLYVMGCLSQRYRAELRQEIPEVDKWFGKFDYNGIVDELALHKKQPSTSCAIERHLTTPRHYAYLKISEGCNRMCSYCAIPLITGRHTSIPMEEILEEVHMLVRKGVKEINVIAQDLSSYGLDIAQRHLLPELIDKMANIDGLKWIRLHYAYPTDFPTELLDVMAKHANVCKYLDIALQHCTDHMLDLMRRHITRAEQDALIQRIRSSVPGICIRTTLMVGHPGETQEDFEELKKWVRAMRFERLGVFTYSDEEGTFAHKHYTDNIAEEIKKQRVDELMSLQQEISNELMHNQIGKEMLIIIDRKENEYYIGRTEHDSPEVDCEVLVKSSIKKCKIGEMYLAKITKAEAFDLYAEL